MRSCGGLFCQSFPSPPTHPFLPDNVIIVPQEKFLAVLSGIINHSDSSHEVNHFLACRVVQVVAALVTPIPINPLQTELASRSCPIRHDNQPPLPTSTRGEKTGAAPTPTSFASPGFPLSKRCQFLLGCQVFRLHFPVLFFSGKCIQTESCSAATATAAAAAFPSAEPPP